MMRRSLAEQATVKAAYRADFIEKAVARGETREEVEEGVRPDDPHEHVGDWRADLA